MSSKKWIAIRVDASQAIGSGHVMRCLSLAIAFRSKNFAVSFICRDLLPNMAGIIEESGSYLTMLAHSDLNEKKYKYSEWLSGTESDDARQTCNILSEISKKYGEPSLVIVDHYALGADWEKRVGRKTKMLTIDDLSDRPHASNWLLDQTFGKTESDYKKLVTDETQLLIGSKYALLRCEFQKRRAQAIYKRMNTDKVNKILVTLGGVDKDNITSRVLEALALCEERYEVTVVAGASNLNFESLKSQVSNLKYPVNLYKQRSDMAELMLVADLCIGAAGSTSWERCVLGLPTINIVLAENQELILNNLDKAGAAIAFGMLENNLSELALVTDSVANDNAKYQKMSKHAFEICDGKGIHRMFLELGL